MHYRICIDNEEVQTVSGEGASPEQAWELYFHTLAIKNALPSWETLSHMHLAWDAGASFHATKEEQQEGRLIFCNGITLQEVHD